MGAAAQAGLIAEAAEDFIVLAEVGAKDPAVRRAPDEWAAAASGALEAGATWVIAEGRASGTVGIYSASGAVREDVVEAMVGAAGTDSLVFEAPREQQQAWFVRRLGPDVNLANIRPADALSLETLRLSLRADTYRARSPGPVPACRP
jgi:phosphosulfolactate synthase